MMGIVIPHALKPDPVGLEASAAGLEVFRMKGMMETGTDAASHARCSTWNIRSSSSTVVRRGRALRRKARGGARTALVAVLAAFAGFAIAIGAALTPRSGQTGSGGSAGAATTTEKPVFVTPPAPPLSEEEKRIVARADELSEAFERVADRVSPAVVAITATTELRQGGGGGGGGGRGQPQRDPAEEFFRRFFGDQAPPGMGPLPRGDMPGRVSTGSGVIVSPDGYILTNNHVVEGSNKITVQLNDNRKIDAKLVGADPATDVAVLKLESGSAGSGTGEKPTFPWAPLGNSDRLRIGQWVVAIGNPFGLNHTVTAGIVSAKGRANQSLEGVQYQDFIQTDAAINPGNSGGPLLNLRGEIVGINSAILSRAGGSIGIGFAIPVNLAKTVMDSLITDGVADRGWLGITMQELDKQLAEMFKIDLEKTQGVLVAEVVPEGPAAAAGLQTGDIIVAINGRATPDARTLRNIVGIAPVGSAASVEVLREGAKKTLSVTVARRDEAALAKLQFGDAAVSPARSGLGITVVTLTPGVAEKRGLVIRGQLRGVLVTEVDRDSRAAGAIRPDDVIVSVNRIPTPDVATFERVMGEVDLSRGVLLELRGPRGAQFLRLQFGR